MGEYLLLGRQSVGSSPGPFAAANRAGAIADRAGFQRYDRMRSNQRRQTAALHASEVAIAGLINHPDDIGPGSALNAFANIMPDRETLRTTQEIGMLALVQDVQITLDSPELVGAAS